MKVVVVGWQNEVDPYDPIDTNGLPMHYITHKGHRKE